MTIGQVQLFTQRILIRNSETFARDTETAASLKGLGISIPRVKLVDEVEIDEPDSEEQKQFDEKAIRAMNRAFERKKRELAGG